VDDAFDKAMMAAQQIDRASRRALRLSEGSEPFTRGLVPRPDRVLYLDNDGQPATLTSTELLALLGIDWGYEATISEYVNVIDYGAAGDGETDDYPAILEALTACLAGTRRVLYFPENRIYRIGTAGVHGIHLNGASNLTIKMGEGAKLLMDNMVDGNAVSHGIFVQGPCSHITLDGCHVAYAAFSEDRQNWAPIFFLGANIGDGVTSWFRGQVDGERPDLMAAGACRNVKVINCTTENSPSVMLGLSGIDGSYVENFRGDKSHADGLYHLYFRNSVVNGARLTNVGDDAISFASYESNIELADITNDFHGECSAFGNIVVDGFYPTPLANVSGGIAFLGVRGVAVSNVAVRNQFRGIRFECGTELTSPYPFLSMLANRNCLVSNVTIENTFQTIACISKEVTLADDDKWWRHSVTVSNVVADNIDSPFADNYCLSSYGDAQYTGLTLPAIMCGFVFDNCRFRNFTENGGVGGLLDCTFQNLEFAGSFGFNGYAPYRGDVESADYPPNHCRFFNVRATELHFTGLKKCSFDAIHSENAAAVGVTFAMCADCTFGTITIKNANRADADFPGGLIIDDLSHRVCGDVVIFDQDDVAVADAVSINSANFHYIKRVIVKTNLNTFYRMVADKGLRTTGISQVGGITWYHSANGFPRWQAIDYTVGASTGVFGDSNFDFYPETSPRTIQIKFPLTAHRVATLQEGAAFEGLQVSIIRTAASTGSFSFTLKGQGEPTTAVIANPARATFRITGGSYEPGVNVISEIRVDGANILPEPIDWGSVHNYENNNEFVARAIANELHSAFLLGATYDALSSGDLVWLTAPAGASYNGKAVTFVTEGDVVFSDVNDFSGGLDAQATGSTPSPYTITALTAAGQGARLIYHYPGGWEVLHELAV
jgi:polygalacturonase